MGTKGERTSQRILAFLVGRAERGEPPPSVREIGAATGLRSPAAVHWHLIRLEAKDVIRRNHSVSRGIELVQRPASVFQVPVIGQIQAGPPGLAVEEQIGFFPLPEVYRGRNCFVLQVQGDSMINASILPGDLVVVERQETAQHGEIVVALLEEEATLKRLHLEHDKITLVAENPAYPPIEPEKLQILGKVIGLFRHYLAN